MHLVMDHIFLPFLLVYFYSSHNAQLGMVYGSESKHLSGQFRLESLSRTVLTWVDDFVLQAIVEWHHLWSALSQSPSNFTSQIVCAKISSVKYY